MSLARPVATGPPAREVPASKAKRQVSTAPAPGAATQDSRTRGRGEGRVQRAAGARRGEDRAGVKAVVTSRNAVLLRWKSRGHLHSAGTLGSGDSWAKPEAVLGTVPGERGSPVKGGPRTREAPSPPRGPCPERVGKPRSPHERGSDVPPEPSVPRRPGRKDARGEEPPPGARLGEEAHGSSVLTKGEALEWAPGGPPAPGTAPSGVPAPCGSPAGPRDLALNLGTRHQLSPPALPKRVPGHHI